MGIAALSLNMNAGQFDRLDYTRKTEAILKGIFLAARMTGTHLVKLYNVSNFYVEVYFHNRSRLITSFRAFDQTALVLPYLDELKIAV